MTDSKVNLICTEQKGRCFITNQDISQGDILFVWKPYNLIPYVTEKDYVCANCIHISKKQPSAKEIMIVCRQNCQHVFYCSNKCEQEHWNKFHQYECSFLHKIFALQDFGYSEEVVNYTQLVMRILTQRLQDILNKPNDMSIEDIYIGRSHFNEFTKEKKKEFEVVAKILTEYILTRLIPHLIEDQHEFINFIQSFLPENTDTKNIELHDLDLWLSEMIHLCSLSNNTDIIETIKYLLSKVFILVCIEEINALFHITFTLEGYSRSPQTYAMGMYPSAAFVNHSCSPNIARFPVQENRDNFCVGDVVFFATRSLKEGEEICYSYLEREYELYRKEEIRADELINSQRKRKQKLNDEFFFDCDCVRCLNESKGKIDISYMALVKELKCTRPECKGWFIPSFDKHMHCEACKMSR